MITLDGEVRGQVTGPDIPPASNRRELVPSFPVPCVTAAAACPYLSVCDIETQPRAGSEPVSASYRFAIRRRSIRPKFDSETTEARRAKLQSEVNFGEQAFGRTGRYEPPDIKPLQEPIEEKRRCRQGVRSLCGAFEVAVTFNGRFRRVLCAGRRCTEDT